MVNLNPINEKANVLSPKGVIHVGELFSQQIAEPLNDVGSNPALRVSQLSFKNVGVGREGFSLRREGWCGVRSARASAALKGRAREVEPKPANSAVVGPGGDGQLSVANRQKPPSRGCFLMSHVTYLPGDTPITRCQN
ncbi:hypothetical protein [Qipengyuania sp. YIM B01966]|uniref:hypothetical protein n=1 Tax=Qipengyuania sp. YIM B01966 TaxID=2778646 RepID=UPI0018F6CE54|nr:hypothetical protein [Qipengyuania sp. YIM B01966]